MADENQGKRGWGGKRPGAGRKKIVIDNSTGQEVTPQAAAPVPTVPATPKQRQPMFSPDSVEAIISAFREMQSKRSARQRGPDWNPYIIRPDRFGPAAVEAKVAKMAMDDNTALMSANQFAVNAWQSGGMAGNDASEGMLFLGYSHLSQLLQRPEFRLFGEIMSEEMTRKWIEFRGTDDESTKEKDKPKQRNNDNKEAEKRRKANGEKPRSDDKNKEIERKVLELKDFAEEIKLRQIFKTIAAHDSGFGIGHLYVDLKGANIENLQDAENKLSIGNGRDQASKAKLGKNCLCGLRVIEPIWCYPTGYNASNPLSPNWYDPDVWYVMGAEIHKTRLIPFIGRPVPDILKPAYAFGGLPMTQMAQPYVDIWLRTRESVAEIIHAFSIMVLSTDLGTTTQPGGSGGGNGDIIARMMLANMLRDNQGMMVIDKSKEDFKNIAAPISGLDELQAQSQEHMFCLSAGALVETDRGQVPIEEVTLKDRVMTRSGFAPICWVGQTGEVSELIEIKTADSTLRATGWHPIWSATTNEFVNAENVDPSHRLLKSTKWGNTAPQSHGGDDGGGRQKTAIIATKRQAACFIDGFTKFMLGRSRMASMFIIATRILSTTALQTLSFFRTQSTWSDMLLQGASVSIGSSASIENPANNAEIPSALSVRTAPSFARPRANQRNGSFVECEIESVRTVRGSLEPVFNIEVQDGYLHEFFANGILVHNSVGRIPGVKFAGITPKGLNACLTGDTLIETDQGDVPIRDVNVGHKVMTRNGWASVVKSWRTKYATELIEICVDGQVLRCTENHPIWIPSINEFVPAGNVRPGSILLCRREIERDQNTENQSSTEGDFGVTAETAITSTASLSCIGKYGRITRGRYRGDGTFITATAITETINLEISKFFLRPITRSFMASLKGSSFLDRLRISGSAVIAGMPSPYLSRQGLNFAEVGAGSLIGEKTEPLRPSRALSAFAELADRLLRRKGRMQNSAQESVQLRAKTDRSTCPNTMSKTDKNGLITRKFETRSAVSSVRRVPAQEWVYDITVASGFLPEFFANGVCVHNSSEGELRAFNDTVHGQQEHLFRPGLTTIVDIMQISLWGQRDPDITLNFLPLYEETQKEKAEIRKIEAETDQIRTDSGVVSQEEVRAKVAADPESGFHGLDPDDVPDLLGEEEEGLIPEGAGKGLEAEIENGGAGPEKPPAGGRKPGAKPSGRDGMPSVAAGIVHRAPDGSVLLLRRSQAEGNYKGHWALPGGKADDGETPESAARRENSEEIGGRAVGALRKVDEVDTPNGMRFHTFLHETAQFEPKLNDEHDGFMWAHPSHLPEPMHPAVKRIVGNLPEVKGGDISDLDDDE